MLACRDVSRLVASDEIARAGVFRRLELRLHLLMCRHCRNYVHQMGLMGSVARRIWGNEVDDAEVVLDLEQQVLDAARAARESPPRPRAGPDDDPAN